MSKFVELLIPALLSAIFVVLYDLNQDVKFLQLRVVENTKYIVVLDNIKEKASDFESRLRDLESNVNNK